MGNMDMMLLHQHTHLSDQVLPDLGLPVEVRQDRSQQASDQRRFVMSCRVEHHQGDTANCDVIVLQALKEVPCPEGDSQMNA